MLKEQSDQVLETRGDEEHTELFPGVNLIKGDENVKVVVYGFEGELKALISKTWGDEEHKEKVAKEKTSSPRGEKINKTWGDQEHPRNPDHKTVNDQQKGKLRKDYTKRRKKRGKKRLNVMNSYDEFYNHVEKKIENNPLETIDQNIKIEGNNQFSSSNKNLVDNLI
jgi:hypothetical protein